MLSGGASQSLCCLGSRLNASGGSEAAVTVRTRIEWIKFRKCRELLHGRKLSLKTKGIYGNCARSAMLCENETWCVRKLEMTILRITENTMIRAMC